MNRKRLNQEKEYSKIRKEYLEEHPYCEAKVPGVCTLGATEIHHKKGRIGELLTNKEFFLAICNSCHLWVESHPIESRRRGFSLRRQ